LSNNKSYKNSKSWVWFSYKDRYRIWKKC